MIGTWVIPSGLVIDTGILESVSVTIAIRGILSLQADKIFDLINTYYYSKMRIIRNLTIDEKNQGDYNTRNFGLF
jgi:hypothetical protein